VAVKYKSRLLEVILFHWGNSPENNRGGGLGCLKCSYGPVLYVALHWSNYTFIVSSRRTRDV